MESLAAKDVPVRKNVYYLEGSVLLLSGIFVFLNPIPHTTAIKEICFYLIILLVVPLLLLKKIQFRFDSPFTVPLALFILWSATSVLWAVDRPNTLHDIYAHLLKQAVIYFVVINLFNTEKKLALLAWIVILSVSIFAVQGMFFHFIVMGKPWGSRLIPDAPINASAIVNLFAFLLALHFLMRAPKKTVKVLLTFCLLVTLATIILSYSRAAMLALIASSLTMLLCMAQQRRKLIALMVLSAIVVALIYYIPSQHKQKSRILPERFLQKNLRIGIYLTSLEIFKDYPLTGVGYGGQTFKRLWKTYHPKIPTEWQLNQLKPASSPHSFFFDILVRLGIVGMALFAFLIIKTLQIQIFVIQTKDTDLGGWGSCLLSALVGTLIGGFFGDILSGPPWLNIFLLLAMTTIIWQLAKEKRNNTTTV